MRTELALDEPGKVAGSPVFRLLGSVQIGMAPRLDVAPKPLQLLVLLLLNAGNPVSTETIIDELWADRPPRSAAVTLQSYVLQTRRTLRSAGIAATDSHRVLATRGRGYVMEIDPDQLDVERFLRSSRAARRYLRSGDPESSRAELRHALAMWRGPALADVTIGPRLEAELVRLNEERLITTELLIDHELRTGRPHEILADLTKIVIENYQQERLCGQLMLAQYRCGRRAQALETYRRMRHLLGEQLGLDPSPVLQSLHNAILNTDERLMDERYLPWDRTPEAGTAPISA